MTTQVVECVPNFSEGQDAAVLRALVEVAGGVPGVTLLDWSADASHNRSVFTLAGSAQAVAEAAFCLCREAALRIDLRSHTGEHPRMGATDVVPFVPLRGIDMAGCIALAKQLGARIWSELGIPVFLYEMAASSPQRVNLAEIRQGQFEGMAAKLKQAEWAPDFGECVPHPTAGVTAVGARMPLIAFNINLDTDRIDIANAIAKSVRASSGGLAHCKAIGVLLAPGGGASRGVAQVSMNLTNYEVTSLHCAFEAVRVEAARWGVGILGSEIIGLTPAKALADSAADYLQLEGFDFDTQVLEQRLD